MSFGKSYPIWHSVSSYDYKTDKSFGARHESTQTIYVGSSASNSHKLAHIEVRAGGQDANGIRNFYLSVDGHDIKHLAVDVSRNGDRRSVVVSSDIQPIGPLEGLNGGYSIKSTMTVGNLMKRLAVLVLQGKGDQSIELSLPRPACTHSNGKPCHPIIKIKEGAGRLVLHVQNLFTT